MSDEAKKEGRDWTADIVPVAVYSLVIFVLLFLYVISPASPPLALRLGSSAGALPDIMHHPDALPQRDPRPWPAQDGCPLGRYGHFEVVHASDVLDDAVSDVA